MSQIIANDESNGNGFSSFKSAGKNLNTSISNEDLSLSEYTDADESMSAPTEYLAEFLSAVLLRDYKNALKYCKLILDFEPNNSTANEFYPLITEKIKLLSSSESEIDENSNLEDDFGDNSHTPSNDELSASPTGITSDEYDFSNSSSEDSAEKDIEIYNSNSANISLSQNDNTTHSYSSLLLEDDDDVQSMPNTSTANVINTLIKKNRLQSDFKDTFNGNVKGSSFSDSESPTEPLTQRIAEILKSKSIPKS